MAVEEALREIDEAGVEVFDLKTRRQAARKQGSRRNTYKKSLRVVQDAAGDEGMAELKSWIVDRVRADEEYPSSRRVRSRGAEIVRERGHALSNESWLDA